jgi:hypothetical protein
MWDECKSPDQKYNGTCLKRAGYLLVSTVEDGKCDWRVLVGPQRKPLNAVFGQGPRVNVGNACVWADNLIARQ